MTALAIVAFVAPANASSWSGLRVMLDPGHGGSDPGALGPSAPHEGALALRCAYAVKSRLEAVGAPVTMTRWDDYDVSLTARRDASVSYDPYIFCSIHLNAFNGQAYGTETWYYWSAGNSNFLAQKVQARMVAQLGRANRGVKQNGWTVITGSSNVPAILTEALFVDNWTEWDMINDENKAGFKGWVNGHLLGFMDHMRAINRGDADDPTANIKQPAINISTDRVHFDCNKGEQPWQDITVTGTDLTENISVWSSSGEEVTVSTGSLGTGGGTVRITMKATAWYGWRDFRVYLRSGDVQREIAVTASVTGEPMGDMQEGWNVSDKRGNAASKGYDARNIRNFAYKDGKLYCVYNNTEIIVLNAQTGEYLGKLKDSNISGGTLRLCDVTVCSDQIIACNLAVQGNNDEFKIYAWYNDTDEGRLIFNTYDFQGATRIGDCMEVTGNVDHDAWFAFGHDDGSTTRMVEYHQGNPWEAKHTVVYNQDGSQRRTGATTRVYPKGSGWWIDGNQSHPAWVTWNGNYNGAVVTAECQTGGQTQGGSHHEFYFRNHKNAVNLVFRGSENYTGGKLRVLRDLAGDFSSVDRQQEMPWDGLGDTPNVNGTGDCLINTDEDTFVEMWVLSTNQGLAYFKYGTPPQHNPGKVNEPKLWFSERDAEVRAVVGQSTVKTLRLEGENLRGPVVIDAKDNDNGVSCRQFTIEPMTLDGPGEVRITYHPDDLYVNWVWLSANSDGAATNWVDIHGDSYMEPTVEVSGDSNFSAHLEESDTHTFTVKGRNLKGGLEGGLWGGDTDRFTYSDTWQLKNNTTVYFDNSRAKWERVYCWIFKADDPYYHYMGCEWPGREMTAGADGIYSYTFAPESTSDRLMVVFANTGSHTQTDDAELIPDATYAAAGRVADRWPHAVPAHVNYDGEITIGFAPTSEGSFASNFYVKTAGRPQNVDVALNATARPLRQSLVPHVDALDFGNVHIDNTGEATLHLEARNLRDMADLYIDGNDAHRFGVSHDKVGATGDITLSYAPGEKGSHYATLHIVIGDEQHREVALSGYSDGTTGIDDNVGSTFVVAVDGGILTVSGTEARAITVYTMAGATAAAATGTNTVAVGHLPAAAYIVAVTDSNGMTRRLKMRF